MSTLKINSITDSAGTGGPSIKGVIDGSAATAGDRGEWGITQMSANVTINNAEATLLAMTLQKGAYQLGYNVTVSMTNSSAAKFHISAAGVHQTYSAGYLAGVSDAGTVVLSISRQIFLNVATTTSYDLMVDGASDSAGTVFSNQALSGNINDPDNATTFWFHRIR